jgi:uncharacterized membrane protein
VLLATLMSDVATAFGLMAAGIAVFGFLMHAKPALSGCDEDELRRLTVIGGIIGCALAVLTILISLLK